MRVFGEITREQMFSMRDVFDEYHDSLNQALIGANAKI
jgi:hypothetical protein